MKRCPACGSGNVRRSGVHSSELGSHAFRSPYRCDICDTRFWVVSRKARIVLGIGLVAAGASIFSVLFAGSSMLAARHARSVSGSAAAAAPDLRVQAPLASLPDDVAGEARQRIEMMSPPPTTPSGAFDR